MAELFKVTHLGLQPRSPDFQASVIPAVNILTCCQSPRAEWELEKAGEAGLPYQLPLCLPNKYLKYKDEFYIKRNLLGEMGKKRRPDGPQASAGKVGDQETKN